VNLRDLESRFSTPEKCLLFIELQRWPQGVRCVTCGSDKVYRVKSKSKKQVVRYLYECAEKTCQQQFTATSGTIMHDSHLSLKTWLMAITLITQAKKGMSAMQVQRTLGIGSYKTAWHLCHRIREAMKTNISPLGGIIEIDETYLGGKKKNRGVFEGLRSKTAVIGLIQRNGQIRLKAVGKPRVDKIDAWHFIRQHVSRAQTQMICTDEAVIYPYCLKEFKIKHQYVNHSAKEYVRYGVIHTNSIEGAFGLLKRGIIGNFHQVSVKHLHRYLSEFEWRWNYKKNPAMFHTAVTNAANGKPLPLRKLLAKTAND
jgi:hypothetical protein